MAKLISLARDLRKRSTDVEKVLWKHLRNNQLNGLKFRRQVPIGKFIVDFICFERRVIVECDGGQHGIKVQRDKERDQRLTKAGYQVLRFWNNEILENIEGVLETIIKAVENPSPQSSPAILKDRASLGGEEEKQ